MICSVVVEIIGLAWTASSLSLHSSHQPLLSAPSLSQIDDDSSAAEVNHALLRPSFSTGLPLLVRSSPGLDCLIATFFSVQDTTALSPSLS
ncbi:hypothetical protein BDV18DRAFT_33456 [Aspergillus unguis]